MLRRHRFIRYRAAPEYTPDFARYEREKNAWIETHPRATPEQYTEAMRAIAQRCGI